MYMPVSFGDPIGEYERLISGVSMWDVGVERQVSLKGPDCLALARLLTGRNLDTLSIGKGKYAPLCDYHGRLINDPVLLQVDDDEIWLSIADSDIVLWARAIAGVKAMNVDITEPDVSPLAVQGPKAEAVLVDLFGRWVSELGYFNFRQTMLGSIPVIVARSGWSKQGGYEIYLMDGAFGTDLWDQVKEAGAPYEIRPGTPNYIERLESGLLSYGADTDAESNPFELGLDRFIDLEQSVEFIGKQALSRIRDQGVSRHFKGIFMDGPKLSTLNEEPWRINHRGQDVGYISAAAFSPRLGSNIAVGMIAADVIQSGESFEVKCKDGVRSGIAVDLPLI
jgi:aminomethyltransferase